MQTLGERLAALRKEKDLSQAELAKLLNLGQSTIAMYERNRRTPDPETLRRFADFFGVSADYLLGRADRHQESGQPASPYGEHLRAVLSDPHFSRLLECVSQLPEEERALLAEGWEWALQVINRKQRTSPPADGDKLD